MLSPPMCPTVPKWSSRPDSADMRRCRRDQSTSAPDSDLDSLASFGFD